MTDDRTWEEIVAERQLHRDAWKAVSHAVQAGKIQKPKNCTWCRRFVEKPKDMHGHHWDHSKPLEVEWICCDCHHAHHRSGRRA